MGLNKRAIVLVMLLTFAFILIGSINSVSACEGCPDHYERPCADVDICEWELTGIPGQDCGLPLGSEDAADCGLSYNTYWPINTEATATCTFDKDLLSNAILYISINNDIINCTLNDELVFESTEHENCAPVNPMSDDGFSKNIYSYVQDGTNTLICTVKDRGIMTHFDACVVGEDYECETDDDCGECEECSENECVFSDKEGPVTSDLIVNPIYNNGLFNLTAIATDTCSNIEKSEYFIRPSTHSLNCGNPGEGKSLNAFDGDFDSLSEDLIKNYAETSDDGQNKVCVQSKDISGNWGNCMCTYFESDTIPPNCAYDIYLDEEFYPNEYLICGNNASLKATVCDLQSDIQGGEYFFDLDLNLSPAPWSGIWMDVKSSFTGEGGDHCAIIEAPVDTSQLTDGTHTINLRGKDIVENWGKILGCDGISFIKDTTAPATDKTLHPADSISVDCSEDEYTLPSGVELTNGCAYVKKGTTIELSAQDPDPQGTEEFAGGEKIYYKIWWSQNCKTNWQEGAEMEYTGTPIELNSDSCHLIEYWSTDLCDNEEEHHYELDIVDDLAPITTKEITGTQINGQTPIHKYLTDESIIKLTCNDVEPHPVKGEILHWEMYWKQDNCEVDDNWGDAIDSGDENDGYKEFTGLSDSCHKFVYYCEDALGNTETAQKEIDVVDNKAPIIEKEIIGPKIPCNYDSELILENKDSSWNIVVDNYNALLKYNSNGPEFDYSLNGKVPLFDTKYALVYYADNQDRFDNWGGDNPGALISTATSDSEGNLIMSGSKNLEMNLPDSNDWNTNPDPDYCDFNNKYDDYLHCSGAKIWLVPLSEYNETNKKLISWNPDNYLFETDLITYEKTDEQRDCYYIDGVTQISVNSYDPEPHPVNNVVCEWSYTWNNEKYGPYTETEFPFIIENWNESEHILEISCKDALGNEITDIETFLVDKTPPTTTKEYGTPFFEENNVEWITPQTLISFTVEDTGPHKSGIKRTYWRNTLVYDDYCWGTLDCQNAVGEGDWETYTAPVSGISESCHLIEYYSVDNVNKTEVIKKQCVFVDDRPPIGDKEIGEPKYVCEEGEEKCGPIGQWQAWYVTNETDITLKCIDQVPHPVEHEKLCFKISLDENSLTDNYCSEFEGEYENEICCVNVNEKNEFTFHFLEESLHKIEWSCEDILGNKEIVSNIEYDNVDLTPPEIIIHNPLPWETDVEKCAQSIVATAYDKKSGVKEVWAELWTIPVLNGIETTNDIEPILGEKVREVELEHTIYNTWEAIMDKELPAGDYTLKVCAKDNLGNINCEEITETLVETVFVEYISPASCAVDSELGGECNFEFHVCMRGDNSIQFWMNKLGDIVTPAMMNATISNGDETFVGLKHEAPYDNQTACEEMGEEYVWEDETCWWHTEAGILQLEEDCIEINGRTYFNLHLDLDSEIITQIGPGIHDLEYWIESSLQCS